MEKEVYGYIYMIRNKINNKIYFGQTIVLYDFNKRYSGGRWWIITTNKHLKRSAKKYGVENFEVIQHFDTAYSKEELDLLEDLYICIYDTLNEKYGYNKKRGGSYGKHTEESKQIMSNKRKGHIDNEITKQRKSKARQGNKNPQYGKPRTEEQKRKQSESMKGKLSGSKNGRAKIVLQYDIHGNILNTYGSATEAAKDNNLKDGSIRGCCRGILKTYGGFIWKYKE